MITAGRLVAFDPLSERNAPFVKLYVDTLNMHRKELSEAAEMLEEQIRAGIIARGEDPDDPDNELEIEGVCQLAFCRNAVEDMRDELEMLLKLAAIQQASRPEITN